MKPAEISQAERSEVPPREARPPPKAAGAEGGPEPREGFRRKLEATKQQAKNRPQSQTGIHAFPGSSAPPAQVLDRSERILIRRNSKRKDAEFFFSRLRSFAPRPYTPNKGAGRSRSANIVISALVNLEANQI